MKFVITHPQSQCPWAEYSWEAGEQEAEVIRKIPECPTCSGKYVVIEKTVDQ